jgi:hypothetical protein
VALETTMARERASAGLKAVHESLQMLRLLRAHSAAEEVSVGDENIRSLGPGRIWQQG